MKKLGVTRPFPYYGNKMLIASEVWKRFGKVDTYCEPFLGSAAVLLSRPVPVGKSLTRLSEVVNDADGLLINFWRSVKHDPARVAHYTMHPNSQTELIARQWWLHTHRERLLAKLNNDPEWYSPKAAGYWLYAMCNVPSMNRVVCPGPWSMHNGKFVNDKERGICKTLPGIHSSGVLRKTFASTNPLKVVEVFLEKLSIRLTSVIMLASDFESAIHYMEKGINVRGFFLDPPYDTANSKSHGSKAYANNESGSVADRARIWALKHGTGNKTRIALCGYTGEHDEYMLKAGWIPYYWSSNKVTLSKLRGKSDPNRSREVIWFSPYCHNHSSLFQN